MSWRGRSWNCSKGQVLNPFQYLISTFASAVWLWCVHSFRCSLLSLRQEAVGLRRKVLILDLGAPSPRGSERGESLIQMSGGDYDFFLLSSLTLPFLCSSSLRFLFISVLNFNNSRLFCCTSNILTSPTELGGLNMDSIRKFLQQTLPAGRSSSWLRNMAGGWEDMVMIKNTITRDCEGLSYFFKTELVFLSRVKRTVNTGQCMLASGILKSCATWLTMYTDCCFPSVTGYNCPHTLSQVWSVLQLCQGCVFSSPPR